MSNYSLQSELNRLQQELNRVEGINRELLSELGIVVTGIGAAHNKLENYNALIQDTLSEGTRRMEYSHQRAIDALEMQGEIEAVYARFKQIELANKKIRDCNNKKYYDFGNYRNVRKVVQALMDNIDITMVSDEAIYKSIEKAHLQTPDYWLTCVLISIMGWRNDNKSLAERSMERSLALDKKSSAIFYMLFNIRMHRFAAAIKWFGLFTECELTGDDQRTVLLLFSLIAGSINDEIDADTRHEITAFIKDMLKESSQEASNSEEYFTEYIKGYFSRMAVNDQFNYTMLNKYCTEIATLVDIMTKARANVNIMEFMVRILNTSTAEHNAFIKEYIDELINTPNQVEKSVYEEIEYNEAIIRFEGDVESAKSFFEQNQRRKEAKLSIIEEMIRWIYDKNEDVNNSLKSIMLKLISDYNKNAVRKFANEYRSAYRHNYHCEIGDYASDVNFAQENEELTKIANFNQTKLRNEKSHIKSWPAIIGIVLGVAAGAGALFTNYMLFIVTALGLGFGLLSLIGNRKKIRLLEAKYREETLYMQETMRGIYRDFREYDRELREQDAYNDKIIDVLSVAI